MFKDKEPLVAAAHNGFLAPQELQRVPVCIGGLHLCLTCRRMQCTMPCNAMLSFAMTFMPIKICDHACFWVYVMKVAR